MEAPNIDHNIAAEKPTKKQKNKKNKKTKNKKQKTKNKWGFTLISVGNFRGAYKNIRFCTY